jgi:glutamyl-tRNA reductase
MYCISISHKTTPVIIREQFAFSSEEQLDFERHILKLEQITGCVIVSTCNRSEIYVSGEKSAVSIIEKELAAFKHIDLANSKKYLNIYSGEGAIKHLFQVTSGLDSMVLGEDEILRQVKDAYQLSLNSECTNPELNIVFQGAISSAKQIKTDTKISNTPVSIGTLTANRIVEFLNTTHGTTILIVGITGKMGSIVAKNLCDKGNVKVIGTSRKHSNSTELCTNSKIQIVDYNDRYQHLKESDVIVSATTSPHYTFTYQETINELDGIPSHKLFIDLAVPGDIDKDILKIPGIDLIDIDDFEKISKDNTMVKLREIDKAKLILEQYMDETLKDLYFQNFYGKMEEILKSIEENGMQNMIYQMKKSLNSEELKIVLESFEKICGGD